jgi:anhydro-N-acetylmuramic acid kinase
MIVAGVMSGTSADGINVALVRMVSDSDSTLALALLGHTQIAYPRNVRRAVLQAMNAKQASVGDIARLNFLLGELYAHAVLEAQKKFDIKADLIGCHGQTLYHQAEPAKFLGKQIATTWQTGEGAVIAARTGAPVVCDFRPADMAAGGKGAPLVPFLDYLVYRDSKIGRIVQNIGGIANLTAIPAHATTEQVFAFDTGPGNMVMDALTERLFGKSYDHDGKIAASGQVMERIVQDFLKQSYFRRKPPKTAGREEFGREFVVAFRRRCGQAKKRDIVATATALTAASIARAIERFVLTRNVQYQELVVSGGGAANPALMAMLANRVRPLGLEIRLSDEFGIPSEAKEAVAFAVLAYQTWHRRPSNIPSATGAKRPAILGKICYA